MTGCLSAASGIKCGVGYDFQLLEKLPTEPHDAKVDFILTPDAVRQGAKESLADLRMLAHVHRQAAFPTLRRVPRTDGGVLGFVGGAAGDAG